MPSLQNNRAEMLQMDQIHRQGLAHWVLIPSKQSSEDIIQPCKLLGHFVDPITSESWSLLGLPCTTPPKIHPCCTSPDTPLSFWTIHLEPHESNDEKLPALTISPVVYQGSDSMRLSTSEIQDLIEDHQEIICDSELEFMTQTIKSGNAAREHVQKYFGGSLIFDAEMIVCIGSMEWSCTLSNT